jgi:hypothetical protein
MKNTSHSPPSDALSNAYVQPNKKANNCNKYRRQLQTWFFCFQHNTPPDIFYGESNILDPLRPDRQLSDIISRDPE